MKTCFKCKKILPLDMFYKHPKMSDGRVNKCKECNKKDVRENRFNKVEYYRKYDKTRGSRKTLDDLHKYREENPKIYKAHSVIQYAKRLGVIKELPCEICGSIKNLHAHHDDYDKPLTIRWLCAAHHSQWHKINEPKNSK